MWTKQSSKLCYSHPFLNVFEDDIILLNGEQINFSRLDLPDFVTVLPLTTNKIVMVRNYRYPANQWFLELPSGIKEKEETPEQCARRELSEETGYTGTFSYVTWYYPIDRSLQKAYIFLANHLHEGSPNRDKTENQQIIKMPVNQLLNELEKGKIKHAPTIIAISICKKILCAHPVCEY